MQNLITNMIDQKKSIVDKEGKGAIKQPLFFIPLLYSVMDSTFGSDSKSSSSSLGTATNINKKA